MSDEQEGGARPIALILSAAASCKVSGILKLRPTPGLPTSAGQFPGCSHLRSVRRVRGNGVAFPKPWVPLVGVCKHTGLIRWL